MRDALVRIKPMPFRDISYNRFGNWLALKPIRHRNGRLAYLCRCDCGTEAIVTKTALEHGKSKSCGCIKNKKGYVNRHNPVHGTRYSAADEFLIRQWYPKYGSVKLSRMLNRSKVAINHKAKIMGLHCNDKRKLCKRNDIWSPEENAILYEHYPKGGAMACIGRLPFRTKNAIWVKAIKLGLHNERVRRRRNNQIVDVAA
jgi:hypothetical protein